MDVVSDGRGFFGGLSVHILPMCYPLDFDLTSLCPDQIDDTIVADSKAVRLICSDQFPRVWRKGVFGETFDGSDDFSDLFSVDLSKILLTDSLNEIL